MFNKDKLSQHGVLSVRERSHVWQNLVLTDENLSIKLGQGRVLNLIYLPNKTEKILGDLDSGYGAYIFCSVKCGSYLCFRKKDLGEIRTYAEPAGTHCFDAQLLCLSAITVQTFIATHFKLLSNILNPRRGENLRMFNEGLY